MQFFDQYRLYIGIACGLGLLVWRFWPMIAANMPGFSFNGDDDAKDLAAFRRLQRRIKCVEGREALKEVGKHFLTEEGAHSA